MGAICARNVRWHVRHVCSCTPSVVGVLHPDIILGHIRMGTCNSGHSCPRGATLSDKPSPSLHYPDAESTSLFPNLIMQSTWLGSDKYQFLSHWFDSTKVRMHEVQIADSPKTEDGRSTHSATPSGEMHT